MKRPEHYINRIGILGGTFNPIHNGHLIIAEDVRERFCLERVLFIPSGQPPHKPDCDVAEAEHRYRMTQLAVASNPFFETSRIETDRNGYTYTVNTLTELHEKYGEGTGLFFIIGADVVPELVTWRDFRQVFRLCEFITVGRPGFGGSDLDAGIERLEKDYGAVIHKVDTRLIEISSTGIRERCGSGKSIRYLTPDDVAEYIRAEGLYKPAEKV